MGCGRFGREIAKVMANNHCRVTVVDENIKELNALQNLYDIRVVHGNASEPEVLRRAGGENAEMIIAVTSNDEVNLVACRLCSIMFDTPKIIARICDNYSNFNGDISMEEFFGIDYVFSPEQIIADNICDIIFHPGCSSVYRFPNQSVLLASVNVDSGGEMVGETIANVRKKHPDIDFRIVAVYRDSDIYSPKGDTRLFAGDEIFIVIEESYMDTLLPLLTGQTGSGKIFISGGGQIGERVARKIEENCRVKIMEHSIERCAYLSASLDTVLVIKGRATDENRWIENDLSDADVYCGLTNDDGENILSSLIAKKIGAKRGVVLINNLSFLPVINREIDNVIVPSQISMGAILSHIRVGDIDAVHSLHRGKAEVIEATVHGTQENCEIIGKEIKNISWPEKCTPGALIRGDEMMIAHDNVVLQDNDKLIVFVDGGKNIKELSKMLQVNVNYF